MSSDKAKLGARVCTMYRNARRNGKQNENDVEGLELARCKILQGEEREREGVGRGGKGRGCTNDQVTNTLPDAFINVRCAGICWRSIEISCVRQPAKQRVKCSSPSPILPLFVSLSSARSSSSSSSSCFPQRTLLTARILGVATPR